ncbi:MAG: GAF domain-containing protein [Hydrogenophaga sp.]|uniref:GAF domain-containing protein n=1 Tax=Hydrogenophaga sp. TaxID=1904254 RepID=UPI0016965C3F|nr:GAF domain-containing protein [Hydrogenophaga sp.]NIM39720.1 GAF domain-containing protein [Hydrogenophaga sp.]NIN24924.1 GAF domain-containing protein [Hydrogenophaga sp.]NIN29436.1 GAF domain-containing protein [Hydrogenophaga sp.]NIN53959.1 GAF domain-containing protein [Hydrogenophaga sp.]NIO50163.1 GAF domain-containing protein [Hydrogenophaga sp.]
MNAPEAFAVEQRATMAELRPCLDGAIPAVMATVAADGTPNVAYLSQVHHVDEQHVALSFQFFNRTRQNLLAHPRSTVLLINPLNILFYRLHLRYLRTDDEGPVFERMRAQLAGIASHEGLEQVFRLRGADIHQVLAIERVPVSSAPALPPPPVRPEPLAVLRRASTRLASARTLDSLLEAALDCLQHELDMPQAMVLIADAATQRLYTVASRGYATSGVGSEIALGHGVIGVAAREGTPVRINHVTSATRYNQALVDSLGGRDAGAEIPYPGLAQPGSQVAVPLISTGRVVGVLFVESEQEMRLNHEDEDLLVTLAGQLAAAIDLMHESEEPCSQDADAGEADPTGADAVPLLRVRRYRRDDSIFVNNAYLIKGVAGAILWKLLNDHRAGRSDFTNRELRLDSSLGLPDVSDNLEARLLLLHRRLGEQCPALRLQKTGRGCFRFDALAPVELSESA